MSALLWRAFAGAVLLFMMLPLGLVVLFSFNESALTSLPLTGFTLDWYGRLAGNESFWPAFKNSLIAGFAVVIAVNAALIWFALGSFSGLSEAHAYQAGLAYNETLAAAKAQERLGFVPQFDFARGIDLTTRFIHWANLG